MRPSTWILLAVVLFTSPLCIANADQFQSLRNGLRSADTETALKAIAALGDSGDMHALPPLLEALRDERTLVRQYALEALQGFARALDNAHSVVKRWLQSLIDTLQHGSTDGVITSAPPLLPLPLA